MRCCWREDLGNNSPHLPDIDSHVPSIPMQRGWVGVDHSCSSIPRMIPQIDGARNRISDPVSITRPRHRPKPMLYRDSRCLTVCEDLLPTRGQEASRAASAPHWTNTHSSPEAPKNERMQVQYGIYGDTISAHTISPTFSIVMNQKPGNILHVPSRHRTGMNIPSFDVCGFECMKPSDTFYCVYSPPRTVPT